MESQPWFEDEELEEVPCEEADELEDAIAHLLSLRDVLSIQAKRHRKRARDKQALIAHRARKRQVPPVPQQAPPPAMWP